MNIGAFLSRIGYAGPLEPTLQTLNDIHRAYLFHVPFENLDIHLGRKIVCDEAAFFHKIVELRRGGFCYEMNGLFAAMVRQLGFRVTLLSARVPREDGTESPEFDHMALRVDLGESRIDEAWLADVGFGDSFLSPLRISDRLANDRSEQPQDGRKFRIIEKGPALQVERGQPDGSWKPEYSFTLVSRQLEDFAPMCLYHQTSPESPFTKKKLCTMAVPGGRVTVSERRVIITTGENKQELILASDEEWHAALKQYFGVVL